MKNKLTNKLSLTDRQLQVICEALDLYSFLNLGNFRPLRNIFMSREVNPQVFDRVADELLKTVCDFCEKPIKILDIYEQRFLLLVSEPKPEAKARLRVMRDRIVDREFGHAPP